MKTLDVIDIIARTILVITTIAVAYLSFRFIFGNSPDLSQINAVFIVMIFGILVTMFKMMYSLNREIGEIKIGMKHSFDNVKEDMNLIKKRLGV